MKKITVLSQGEILDSNFKISKNDIVISFFNTDGYDILRTQEVGFISNQTLLDNEDNILLLNRDDIQKMSFLNMLRHQFKPYSNIFNKQDVLRIERFLKLKSFENKNIIIQCEFGKSRSLSLAIALQETMLKDSHLLEHEENKIRNPIIYNLILKYFKNYKKK